MDSVTEMKGASILVEDCARVKEGETVLIVTDWQTADVAERVAAAANERNANVTVSVMDTPKYDGYSPPEPVAASMLESDVIFMPLARSITHSAETKQAVENGARCLSLVGFRTKHLSSGGLYADFEAMRPKCREVAQKFSQADEAHVTTELGTDVTFGLESRDGNAYDSIIDEPGMFSGAVNIEANIAPEEGSASGRMVFDGAIPNLDIGLIDDPVIMDVEDGAVTNIEGGKEARTIERAWEEHDDPAVYNIAQLAVGMNPECKEFTGWWKNAHGVYGSVHVGIGTSSNLGGTTRAPVHFDAAMSEATLKLDGETIIDEGDFTLF